MSAFYARLKLLLFVFLLLVRKNPWGQVLLPLKTKAKVFTGVQEQDRDFKTFFFPFVSFCMSFCSWRLCWYEAFKISKVELESWKAYVPNEPSCCHLIYLKSLTPICQCYLKKNKVLDLLSDKKTKVVFKNIFYATTGTTFYPSCITAIHLLRFQFPHSYLTLLLK